MNKNTQWANLTGDQMEALADTWRNNSLDKAVKATRIINLAKEYGLSMTPQTLVRRIQDYIFYQKTFANTVASKIAIPISPKDKCIDYHIIKTDNVLILSDLEVPDHNMHMLMIAYLDALNHGVKHLIWNGDLVAVDQDSLNSFVNLWQDSDMTTLHQDITLLEQIINQFSEWFGERQWATLGNHDDILNRKSSGELSLELILRHSPVKWSRYPYLYVETTSRGYIKVLHPRNFSKNPVTLMNKHYNSERGPNYPNSVTKAHLVGGHCHRAQWGFSEDGLYELHGTGMLRDDIRTSYKMRSGRAYAQWDAGYAIIINGFIHNRTLRATNWHNVLGEYYQWSPFVTHPQDMLIPYIEESA